MAIWGNQLGNPFCSVLVTGREWVDGTEFLFEAESMDGLSTIIYHPLVKSIALFMCHFHSNSLPCAHLQFPHQFPVLLANGLATQFGNFVPAHLPWHHPLTSAGPLPCRLEGG
jgi:hypothetical protein